MAGTLIGADPMHPVGAPVDELTGIRILPQYGSQFLARDFAFVRIKPRSRHGQGIDRNFVTLKWLPL